MKIRQAWNPRQIIKENTLLRKCSDAQGAAINVMNRAKGANGATTYRAEFCDTAAELWSFYKDNGYPHPLLHMAKKLRAKDIRTCRGYVMTDDWFEYLFKIHLAKRVNK